MYVLVLDLDNTLLQSTTRCPRIVELTDGREDELDGQIFRFDLDKHGTFWVKVRPGVRKFLEDLYDKYELVVATNGVEPYARQIVKFLDPEGKYFKDRISARENDLSEVKCLYDLQRKFNLDVDTCLVVDDRIDVWKDHESDKDFRAHVLRVKPFAWFDHPEAKRSPQHICRETQYVVPKFVEDDLQFDDKAQKPLDVIREKLLLIYDRCTRTGQSPLKILAEERKKVLKDCNIQFSQVFRSNADKRKNPIWLEAEMFGASLEDQTKPTTHLVMLHQKSLTEKYRQCSEDPRIKIVRLAWLLESCALWRKQHEALFPLHDGVPQVNLVNQQQLEEAAVQSRAMADMMLRKLNEKKKTQGLDDDSKKRELNQQNLPPHKRPHLR